MTTDVRTYKVKSIPKATQTAGLIGIYALLLCPFIIATPKSDIGYWIDRLLQLMSIVLWIGLHIKKSHPIKSEHRLFVYGVLLWWIVLNAITLLRVPNLQFTQVYYWLTVWNILLLAELYWHKDYVRHLNALSILLSFLVYLSTVLYILFPEGLWFDDEWIGAGDKARYLFGNYNQTGVISLIALMVSGAYTLQTGRGYMNMLMLSLVSIGTVIAMGSMTSTVGILIVVAYFFLRKIIKHPFLWIGAFLFVYVAFFAVVVWSGNDIQNWPALAGFVENVLGKNSTFTMRIYLWLESVVMILESPWTGYGVQGVEWMVDNIGGSGPHNLWLMILLVGGVVLCGLFIGIIACIFVSAAKRNSSPSAFAVVCICVILLMSLFEAYHFICTFSMLIIAYYICVTKYDKKKKRAVAAVTGDDRNKQQAEL